MVTFNKKQYSSAVDRLRLASNQTDSCDMCVNTFLLPCVTTTCVCISTVKCQASSACWLPKVLWRFTRRPGMRILTVEPVSITPRQVIVCASRLAEHRIAQLVTVCVLVYVDHLKTWFLLLFLLHLPPSRSSIPCCSPYSRCLSLSFLSDLMKRDTAVTSLCMSLCACEPAMPAADGPRLVSLPPIEYLHGRKVHD